MRQWMIDGLRFEGLVKRTQVVSANTGGAGSNTATILAVDLANAILVYVGQDSNSGGSDASVVSLTAELTNATTVTFTRGGGDGSSATGYAVIFEFWPGVVRSVQRVSRTADGTVTLTIPVGANAIPLYLGRRGPGGVATAVAHVSVTAPATVTFAALNTGTGVAEIVDFY
jgi:hypothetical protein